LQYHTSSNTEGALVPQAMRKVEKYATVTECLMSTTEKMMNPVKVNRKPRATKGNLQRVRSEENPRMSSMTAPVMLGATV
jgi:hypothetical protein